MGLHEERLARFERVDIYPVVTEEFCGGRSAVEVLDRLLEAGALVVQLREKRMSDRDLLALARVFRERTRRAGCLLIVDDRPHIAVAVDADGVHLGQEDFPAAEARRLWPDLIVGVSTHNAEEILRAQEAGASYINIGPVFPTSTKAAGVPPLGLDRLRELIPLTRVPFTVMGGIKESNIRLLRDAGCRRFAMVTELTQAEDIVAKFRALRRLAA